MSSKNPYFDLVASNKLSLIVQITDNYWQEDISCQINFCAQIDRVLDFQMLSFKGTDNN